MFRKSLVLCLVLFMSVFVVSYANAGYYENVVAHFSFDDSGNLGNNDHGVVSDLGVHNGAPAAATGVIGGAADFDGVDDSLYFLNRSASNAAIYPAGDFTVATWVRADVVTTSNAYVTRNRYLCGYAIVQNAAGVWTVIAQDGLHSWTTGAVKINGPSIVAGQWAHITMTYDSTSYDAGTGIYTGDATMYVNGVFVETKTLTYRPRSDSIPSNNDRFGIGYDGVPTSGSYFNGAIDDFGVWNVTMEAKGVASLYASGLFADQDLFRAPDTLRQYFNIGPGSSVEINGLKWFYTTGLGNGPIGTVGGSVETGDAFVILDGFGNGMAIPEPATIAILGLGALVSFRRNSRVR